MERVSKCIRMLGARGRCTDSSLAGLRLLLLAMVLLALPALPLQAASGGPDGGGYTWRDCAEGVPNAAPGAFASTTNLMPAFEGAGLVTTIPLPASIFPNGFPFYGQRYDTAYLSSNGWLSFVDPLGSAVSTSTPLPTAGTPDATIAMLWAGLRTMIVGSPGTGVGFYGPYDTGDAWGIYIRYYSGLNAHDVELVLFNSGTIRIIYHRLDSATVGDWATIGIENETGSAGTQILHEGLAAPGVIFEEDYAVEFTEAGLLNCANPVPIACGATLNGASPGPLSPQGLNYSCAGQRWEGNERVFSFSNPTLQEVNLELSSATNQAVFVLDSCSTDACLAGGAQSITFPLLPAGNFTLVVDGLLPSDDGPFTLAINCAGSPPAVACDDSVTDATSGVGAVSGWDCSSSNLDGPENFYTVTLPSDGHLSARLVNADPDLEVLVFDPATFSIGSPRCLTGGASSVTLFDATAGTYGIAVEGADGASGSYTLEVGCGAQLDCDPGLSLSCGTPSVTSGSTVGLIPKVDRYDCRADEIFSGPEEAHTITVTQPSTLFAELLTNEPDLEALFVTGCDEGDCIPASGPCIGPIDPGEYQVVVDGKNGAEGDYDLNVWCFEPETFGPWFACEGPGGAQTPETTQSDIWQFNTEANYCPDGCDFAMYVVVECGQEFHLPFYDVESGHIRIYDILKQEYVMLEAENNVPVASPLHVLLTGTDIEWISDGCPGRPPDPTCPDPNPGGCDERYNNRIMDVRFFGTPSVCGVYRMELLGWGGFAWELFANCTGTNTPGFMIYSNFCDALAAWNALPELQMTDVEVINFLDCPEGADVEITVINTGCEAAVDVPVLIENSTGDPNQEFTLPFVGPGETVVVPVRVGPFTGQPADVTITLDDGTPGTVFECNEAGSNPVTCSPPANVSHEATIEACPLGCTATAGVAEPNVTICQGDPVTLDGSVSRLSGCLGQSQYRWEAIGDPGQTRDWDPDPLYTVTPSLTTIYRLTVRCSTDLTCMSEALMEVAVTPNVSPPRAKSPIRGLKDLPNDVLWAFTPPSDSTAASTRLYSSAERTVDPLARGLVAELPLARTTFREVGGLADVRPLVYYQLVAVSCAGDLESPY